MESREHREHAQAGDVFEAARTRSRIVFEVRRIFHVRRSFASQAKVSPDGVFTERHISIALEDSWNTLSQTARP
jgi:hypothetical protein